MGELAEAVDAVFDALFRSELLRIIDDPRVGGRFPEAQRVNLRRIARGAPIDVIGRTLYALDGEWTKDGRPCA